MDVVPYSYFTTKNAEIIYSNMTSDVDFFWRVELGIPTNHDITPKRSETKTSKFLFSIKDVFAIIN